MVSLADVKRWKPGVLEEVLRTVQKREQILIYSGDDLGRVIPAEGWSGPAAVTAGSAHQSLMSRLDTMAAGVSIVAKAIGQASDAIPAVQHAITNAEELALKYGFQVGDDGQVIDQFPDGHAPLDMHPEDRARVRSEVTDAIAQTLRTAEDIDNDLALVLQRAEHGEFGTGSEATVAAAAADGAQDSGLTLLEPPENGTPGQNAGWWDSLSPAGQAILLRDHPDWLGNLDGLPGMVRSQANLARLPQERARLEAERKRLQQQIRSDAMNPLNYLPLVQAFPDDFKRLNEVEAKLTSLDAIDHTIAHGNRQLLTLDTSGRRVKAAIVVGNVDTAEHVAVFTPGFTSTVNGSLQGYDSAMYQLDKRAQDLASRYGDGRQVATVTWIGYEAPQLGELTDPSHSVVFDNVAKEGAANLDGFLNGIGASHDVANRPLHLTALGHSYGSLTTGIALQHQTPVHDAVVFGSPGMDIHKMHDLKVPDGHVYSEWARGDFVPDLDIADHFGVSPYSLSGIDHLNTGDATSVDGQSLAAVEGHSDYLNDNSTSQYNMAAITVGRSDLAIADRSTPALPR